MIGTTISILSVSAMALVRAEARGKRSEENGRENMRLAMESRLNFKKKKTHLDKAHHLEMEKYSTPLSHQTPADLSARVLASLATALLSALLMNICIVGVNQVYDVEIDAVAKPHLPIPAGDLSVEGAAKICAATGALSLAIGVLSGSAPLLLTLAGSLALGFAYSADLPLLRWKRYPAVAAACIIAVRTVAVQGGFFSHARLSAGLPLMAAAAATAGGGSSAAAASSNAISGLLSSLPLPLPLAFAVGMMLAFSVGIAVLKDTPDTDGDEQAGVRTLAVQLGPRAMLSFGTGLLLAAYAAACVLSLATQAPGLRRGVLVAGHAAAGALLAGAASRVDSTSRKSITKFYMFIWKLFYAEYALIPLMR
jgi:homogentisate phytyltransferase / homogentisate geranylgeranyltransferase